MTTTVNLPSGTKTYTTAQLTTLKNDVISRGVDGAIDSYTQLQNDGYSYAGWAKGVATNSTTTGQAANGFLETSAGNNLSDEQIANIKTDMAIAYLDTLIKKSEESGGTVNTDVNYKQTEDFHRETFEKHKLTIDNWTLKKPMDIIEESFGPLGEKAQEVVWNLVRETEGEGVDALTASGLLSVLVAEDALPPSRMEILINSQDLKGLIQDKAEALKWLFTTLSIAPDVAPTALEELKEALENYDIIPKDILALIDPPEGTDPDDNTYQIRYYDPIALDLDGDGIETIDDDGYDGALFDHNGDGFRTATGWVSADDGILVRDINGNGTIDTGAELFGDNTLLVDGTTAPSGMQALADLDSNGDGIIDSQDSNFNELKVWQDKNSDGISTADELLTLTEVGISNINLTEKQTINQSVEGGFTKEQATFTKSDGSTGEIADINFDKDAFSSKYTDTVTVSEDIAKLPYMDGIGRLADIHQSAMLSDELASLLDNYSKLTSRKTQTEALDELMLAWASTDPQYVDNSIEIINQQTRQWVQSDDSTNIIWLRRGQQVPEYLTRINPKKLFATDEIEAQIKFSEAFLGVDARTVYYQLGDFNQIQPMLNTYNKSKAFIYDSLLTQTILKPYVDKLNESKGDFSDLNSLFMNEYQKDSLGTLEDLKDLLRLHSKEVNALGWEDGFTLVQTWREELSTISDELKVAVDEIFLDVDVQSLNGSKKDDFVILANDESNSYFGQGGNDTIIINSNSSQTVDAGEGNDIIVSGIGNDYLSGGKGINTYIFSKGCGEDFVSYDNGSFYFDKLIFDKVSIEETTFYQQGQNLVIGFGDDKVTILGALDESSIKGLIFEFENTTLPLNEILDKSLGNLAISDIEEYINGWRGSDSLTGNDTDNQIFAYDGNDQLTGGKGNDILTGGAGADTYYFSSGDGADTIVEANYSNTTDDTNAGSSPNSNQASTLVFKDINAQDIHAITFEGDDLVIQYGSNATDKLTLQGYIDNTLDSDLNIKFADGTEWSNADLMTRVTFEGSDENDTITGTLIDRENIINGYDGRDTIHGNEIAQNIIDGGAGWDEIHGGDNIDHIQGGSGEDFIYGEAGADEIYGQDDHDTLFGGEGDDHLEGGDGHDWLQGDAGSDTLIGGKGNDSYDVDELDTFIENADEGYDAIFIEDSFDVEGTNLEEIHLKGDGNYNATGDAGDNGLYGNSGDNILDGEIGADIMSGGAGNDYYIVDQYETLVTNEDGTTDMKLGDQVVEGIIGSQNTVHGDTGGIDTVEQWDDHRFYSRDESGNWIDTGKLHHLQDNVENVILKGEASTAFGNELDNIITLNEQDNFVNGLGGNDTIIYRKGGGQDSISVSDAVSANDTLIIEGYTQEQTSFTKEGDNLLIRFDESEEHIWINDYFIGATETTDNKVDTIIFRNTVNDTLEEVALTQEAIDKAIIDRADNHTPEVNENNYPQSISVDEGETINVQFDRNSVIDQDEWDSELDYIIITEDKQPLPDWLHFDPDTMTLTGTPTTDHIGTHTFFLMGTDLFGDSKGPGFTITVYSSDDNNSSPTDPEDYTHVEDGTESADQMVGTGENDILNGLGGNDQLFGYTGSDQLNGGDGNDYLSGGLGQGTGSGNDTLNGGNGNDRLYGEDGNDTLIGGAGDDSYTYKANDGIDTIDNTGGGKDRIFFSDIDESQLSYHQDGDDLVIMVDGDSNQQVRVLDHFISKEMAIDYIVPSNGYVISASAFEQQLTAIPESEKDPDQNPTEPNTGEDGNNTGDDIDNTTDTELSGDNTIRDTLGNDKLAGGAGNDTYIYTGGQDTLTDTQGVDKLVFADGITFNQVAPGLMQAGNDLVLKVNGSSSNQITLTNYFSDYDSIIETIEFEAGGSISHAQIFNLFGIAIPEPTSDTIDNSADNNTDVNNSVNFEDTDFIGTDSNDNLQGTTNSDRLQGLLGDDVLEGQAGDDILVAGKGNDTLIGNEGNDLYYVEEGFGNDTIINTGGGIDNISFDGFDFNDVASGLQKEGNDLILNVNNSTDSLTLKDFFTGGDHAELNISFESSSYSISAEQLLGAFGHSNPNTSNTHSQAEYQSSLVTMLGLMDEFNMNSSADSSVI